jgi:hypothetical protein
VRESRVESFLVRRCNEEGFACWKFSRPGRNSAFDRVVPMPRGKVIWIETKRSDEWLSPAQRREWLWLTALGHTAICVNSKDAVETFVEEFLFQ